MQESRQQRPNSAQRITGRGFRLPIDKNDLLKRIGIEYLHDVRRRGRSFENTEQLKSKATEIAEFLTEETDKYGLFICGNVGNGKSTIVRSIYNVVNDMVSKGMFSNGGEVYSWDYMRLVDAREMVRIFIRDYDEEFKSLKARRFLIIDDLGTDQKEVSLYGTVFTPFMELLDYRYEKLLPTIIVSNLNASKIVEKYDDPRLSDRMREMFKIISFENKSFR